MTTASAVLAGAVALLLFAIAMESRLRRGKTRPLAARFTQRAEKPALGLEATDLDLAADILQKNDALAAKTGSRGSSVAWTAVGAIPPRPRETDEG